jgi:two-component system, OmpR family, KDP operon response regulator KdpE
MSAGQLILVIDDEPQILRILRAILTERTYRVILAGRGEDGLAAAASEKPDLIILDLGLPDMDGVTVCARLREWTQTPIIVLSVCDQEKEKVRALDMGADDYLVKPFGIEELLARIRVGLRHSVRTRSSLQPVVHSGDLEIDLSRHVVMRKEEEVKLTATEFKLLAYLASQPDRVLTHASILKHVWGREYMDNMGYLRVYMTQLRRKLEENPKEPRYLLSEPAVGYRFYIQPRIDQPDFEQ